MASERSLEKLLDEIKNLRMDFSRVSESMVDRARQQTHEAASRVRHVAEDAWSDTMGAASDVADRIEEQPLAATAIAFGVGMLLGMLLLSGRKR
ncbi:MAG: hypothetical protein ABSD74_09865 [Rhizomicrobium sp.]|jgi:ElaB/YqjD/DUF883 family membrane-anchored ribosome-binding protein